MNNIMMIGAGDLGVRIADMFIRRMPLLFKTQGAYRYGTTKL
ncbi:hypothetical protein [Photobacterium sagamiensis]